MSIRSSLDLKRGDGARLCAGRRLHRDGRRRRSTGSCASGPPLDEGFFERFFDYAAEDYVHLERR